MSSTAKITLLTPVRNGLPYIRECIESVLSQPFTEWEMVISDNCSDDGTRDFLRTIHDPRIRIFEQEKNRGIFGNLNFLVQQVRTAYFQVLCADDYLLPDGLSRIVQTIFSQPEPSALFRFNWVLEDNLNFGTFWNHFPFEGKLSPEQCDLYMFAMGNIIGNLTNVAVHTESLRAEGDFREDMPYVGDYEMWGRLAHRTGIFITRDKVAYVRRHPGVASNYLNAKGESVEQRVRVCNSMYKRLLERGYSAFDLKLYATAFHDGYQRRIGFNKLVRGDSRFIKAVMDSEKLSIAYLHPFFRWFLFVMTFFPRTFFLPMTKSFYRKHLSPLKTFSR